MSGMFSAGGLMSGIDTNSLISQLLQIERQPILRFEQRINALEQQKSAVQDLRSQLSTLRNRAQDFRFSDFFDQFTSEVSNTEVLSAESGVSAAAGSYLIDVQQLASSTSAASSARMGAGINPAAALNGAGGPTAEISAGTFSINGEQFTIGDPNATSLNDLINAINGNGNVGVNASYDAATDRLVFTNRTVGDGSVINFGGSSDTSNFLSALGATGATQTDDGSGTTTATGSVSLGAVDLSENLNAVSFAGGGLAGGTFRINGVSIAVDPATDSMADVIGRINASDAGVRASYDASNDKLQLSSTTEGSRLISFQAGTSNFLSLTNLDTAVQTAGKDAQFTINGGALQTRNSNSVTGAITGVEFSLLSTGQSTITVAADEQSAVDAVQGFLDEFNAALTELATLTETGGTLSNDAGIRSIQNALVQQLTDSVASLSGGAYDSLIALGIGTGDAFNADSTLQYELDSEKFLEALRDNPTAVAKVFSNDDEDGILNLLENYLDGQVDLDGALNQRAKGGGSIDQRIDDYNSQIDQRERRLEQYETRLRSQFTAMEQTINGLNSQGSSLSSFQASLGGLI